ncbi:response regulator [Actinoallomurus acaciae]|uniref:Response regulator n=1 Tax=Actinoallomurus acaciae TaxID=502577 RepID=A0ABV5Y804_9ACTN
MDETMISPTLGSHGQGAGASTLRCLIVDDDDHFRRVAGDLLEGEEIAIIGVASTGSQALRLHDELQPDVTLIDIVLGEENGFDLAEQLTAIPRAEPITVILMSAALDREEVADVIAEGGAAAFLPKLDISRAAVREICRRSGLTTKARSTAWFYPPPGP